MRVDPLGKLAFGERDAPLLTTAEAVHDFLIGSGAVRSTRALRSLTRFKAASLRLPGLKIFSSAADPFELSFAFQPAAVPLFVPLSGMGRITCRGRRQPWQAGEHVVIGSCQGGQSYSFDTPRSVLFLLLDEARLADTLRLMAGHEATGEEDPLMERTRMVTTSPAQANLRALLVSALALADLPGNDPDYLRRIGFDDVIHRMVADFYASLLGRSEGEVEAPRLKRSLRALDVVCEHIATQPGLPLTLSDMERMTGMTSRSLNNAFRERFATSPQEWQRNFRLDQARALILQDAGLLSVKAIARQFGFISPYSFSTFYRKRFGELPSETLRGRGGVPSTED